ncbi:MAG: hypothetical protein M3R72_01705 [Bacteroidota bacterium]|nr:hypothetical protein [Bacteroidota bacterium]
MNYDYKQTLLSKCALSGVMAGFAAVLFNVIYNFIYRSVSGYALSEVFNITSLIFSSILFTLVASIILFFLLRIKSGQIIYVILFLLLTVAGIYAASQTQRSDVAVDQHEFRILFTGIVIIDGLCAAFVVPYLVNHDKLYS